MTTRTPLAVSLLLLLATLVACHARRPATQSPPPAYPKTLQVVTHERWGWQPPTRTLPTHEISKITIHHGGEDTPRDIDPVSFVRELQRWSRQEKGWMDIPYHFMIDFDGRVYEARPLQYPGDTNTRYDPAGHALICVIGNYENQMISPEQLDAVVQLSAHLAWRYAVAVEEIRGHRDYAETLCPGRDLYRYLQDGTIQERVRALLAGQE